MEEKKTYVIEAKYSVKYTTKDPVSIPDIIRSLEATEKLLKRTPKFIEAAYTGFKVDGVEVYVEHLDTGSLVTDFIVKYVVKEKNAKKIKEVVDDIMNDNQSFKTLVAVSVGIMVGVGAMSIIPESKPTTHIEAHNDSIVIMGSQVGLSEEAIFKIVDKLSDKKSLAKEVVDYINPARGDSQATIEVEGMPELEIDRDFIDETPATYTPPTPDEKSEAYTNVPVSVFASDKDRTESGWAGIVPGVVDKRVKFVLDEGVDPAKLHGNTALRADIEVESRFIKSRKKYEVHQVIIKKTN